ncbi:MAG: DUF3575 domain-containing protein [Bacteroidia bacterium]|nr:DUF3575 domain-containing protein [Bacteroidia bacterium]MDW8135024.1 DUF3575 domain-containing protein [Bacteroidia bacterium]
MTSQRIWQICLSLALVWAQVEEDRPEERQLRQPVLKFFPLALMDPFQYTLQLGLEVPASSSSSFQVEAGWVFGHLGFEDASRDLSQQGFKARLQWREYLDSSPPKNIRYTLTGPYLGLQGGFQFYQQNLDIDTAYVAPPTIPSSVPYERTIQAFSLSLLVGYQLQVGTHLVIDIFGGVGARYSQHRWRPQKPPISYYPGRAIGDIILRPGGRPIPHIGLSVGWIFH